MNRKVYSKQHLYNFLEVAQREQLIESTVGKRWHRVASEMLQNASKRECEDLRQIDIDSLCRRFARKMALQEKSITPWDLFQAKQNLQDAVGDFIAFVINPHAYRQTAREVEFPNADMQQRQTKQGTKPGKRKDTALDVVA